MDNLKKRISIFGLGYVGSVTSACLASKGHQVIGVDLNEQKVEEVNNGKSPIVEEGLSDLISQGIKSKNLHATVDSTYAINNSDISFIAVGTPSKKDGSLDLTYVETMMVEIGLLIAKKSTFHTIVIRSTVLPSSCEKILIPLLEKSSSLKSGKEFGFIFNPEFLRESTAIFDFNNPPKTVIGTNSEKDAEIVSQLYGFLDAPEFITSIGTAEMVKYADNAFHATKVVFGNEIGAIAKSMNINSHEVMDIFCSDTKLNISKYYLKPGFAFGGSCLPKDVRALSFMANDKDVSLPLVNSLIPSNNAHINRAFNIINKYKDKKIGIMGFSFKDGTDDTRESPIISLIELCSQNSLDIKVYDPNINLDRLIGSNKESLEGSTFNLRKNFIINVDDFISQSEFIIIGNGNKSFISELEKKSDNQMVLDLVGLDLENILGSRYMGFCW